MARKRIAKPKQKRKPVASGDKLSDHHLIPRSRDGSSNERWNIRRIRNKFHEAWHLLFSNCLPEEIIIRIVNDWSPRGYFHSVTIVKNRDFPSNGTPDIAICHPEDLSLHKNIVTHLRGDTV